ncbi:MAG: nitroreductase family protein [Chloroflexi bacterium]|nr:nitroreductase family protein [Chloroflexota bacterium]
MEFFEVVKKRYSHKTAFDPQKKVPEEDLVKIVEAGMAAPSAGNGQSPEFIIINDEKVLEQIRQVSDNVPLNTAPALIAVLTRPRARQVLDIATECLIADLAAATDQMLLAATALGYCCGWLDSPFVPQEARTKAEAALGIPPDRMLLLVVPVGYPAEPGPRRPKKPFEQRASWNRYAIQREAQE